MSTYLMSAVCKVIPFCSALRNPAALTVMLYRPGLRKLTRQSPSFSFSSDLLPDEGARSATPGSPAP